MLLLIKDLNASSTIGWFFFLKFLLILTKNQKQYTNMSTRGFFPGRVCVFGQIHYMLQERLELLLSFSFFVSAVNMHYKWHEFKLITNFTLCYGGNYKLLQPHLSLQGWVGGNIALKLLYVDFYEVLIPFKLHGSKFLLSKKTILWKSGAGCVCCFPSLLVKRGLCVCAPVSFLILPLWGVSGLSLSGFYL